MGATERKAMKIIETEISDSNEGNHEKFASAVSVLVNFEIKGQELTLEFQTSGTMDYGAISTDLEAYDGWADYDQLEDLIDDDDTFESVLDDIKIKSEAQKLWNDYMAENYILDTSHFGGMDANSSINRLLESEEIKS